MKKLILITLIALIVVMGMPMESHASVKGITAKNYLTYEKIHPDAYGFNKGECEHKYLKGEEWFYSEYIDHWNVDRVYDIDLIPKGYFKKIGVKAKAKPHKIRMIKKSNGIAKRK